jgi:hypothetical protein
MSEQDISAELAATVEARKELGPAHERELVEGFVDRIHKEIDRRVDERVAQQRLPARSRKSREAEIGVFVPLFIIAGIFGGVWGIAATAAALVVVFLVSELRR